MTDAAPRVSIITATYNATPFLERTVSCVLAQSFADFEWIVVDDGSSDGTAERVALVDDERIRLFRRPNGGPSAARNTGLAEVRGELIALLDHDDAWAPTRLERLVRTLDEDPHLGFASSNMFNGDPDEPDNASTILDNPDCVGLGLEDPRTWLRGCSFSPSTSIVRAETLRRFGGWEEQLWYAQDWELVLRLWLGGERATMLAEPLGWTVIRAGQLSGNHEGTFGDRHAVLRRIERTLRDAPLVEQVREQRLAWELDEARRRLGSAMGMSPTNPLRAREQARWALRRPLGGAELGLAVAFALNPRLASWLTGLARRVMGRS